VVKKPDNFGHPVRPALPVAPHTPVERASRAGIRLLKFKDRTRAELLARLTPTFGAQVARDAVDGLEAAGLTGDRRVAREFALQRLAGKLESAALVRRTLRRRGVSRDEALAAISQADIGRSDLDRARELLTRSRERLGAADPVAARRRASGLLARRGFDADTASRAIDDVLGPWREPDNNERTIHADL